MIAFLGCGEMNEAIMAGLLEAGTAPEDVVATVRRAERVPGLASRYPGVRFISSEEEPEGNRSACEGLPSSCWASNRAIRSDWPGRSARRCGRTPWW